MSPVKKTDRKINDGGIQAKEFIFEPEPFLSYALALKAMEKAQEEVLIKAPGAVFVGIGQGGAARSGNTQMLQFAFTAFQATRDFSEGMRSSQVAEEHSHELPPAAESSGMAFGVSPFHGPVKFISRKEL